MQYNRTAIITGISGQDGAYLAALLLSKGYRVIGFVRSSLHSNLAGLQYLKINERVIIEECDLTDLSQVLKLIDSYLPDEIYNLAAQSSVSLSFKQPIGTFHFNTISVFNLLEAIKMVNPKIRFYQASSSEMYGKVATLPITENTVFHPLSPYAISKASAHWSCIHYRESYGLFIACGILFNHESVLRNTNFFIKKVIKDSLSIKAGKLDMLQVGNIDIKRDFGFAPKYVEAMYLMLQQNSPSDYTVCSGKSITLRSIIEYVFEKLEIPPHRFEVSEKLYRPSDIQDIYGDPAKARKELGWNYDLDFFDVIDGLIEEELKFGKIIEA